MTIKIPNIENPAWIWTDETCSSRYGLGCIQIEGVDYGVSDVPASEQYGRTVGQVLQIAYSAALDSRNNTEFPLQSQVEIIQRFLNQAQLEISTERFGY